MTDKEKQQICDVLAIGMGLTEKVHPDPICRPHYKWVDSEGIWKHPPEPFDEDADFIALLEWTHKQEWFGWTEIFQPLGKVCVRFFHVIQLHEEESVPFSAHTAETFREAFIIAIYNAIEAGVIRMMRHVQYDDLGVPESKNTQSGINPV